MKSLCAPFAIKSLVADWVEHSDSALSKFLPYMFYMYFPIVCLCPTSFILLIFLKTIYVEKQQPLQKTNFAKHEMLPSNGSQYVRSMIRNMSGGKSALCDNLGISCSLANHYYPHLMIGQGQCLYN